MAFPSLLNGKTQEEHPNNPLDADRSFTAEDKSFSANSSFTNSPLLDKEKILRYSVSSRDEFWDALSSNYDYLMDDGLIATCREASSDLSLDDESEIPESCCWSFTQFIEQFKWLHDLLHNLQVAKEGDGNKTSSKTLEEQQKIAYLCKLFNEQAQKLSKRYPDMRDEVHRHLNLLNNKWKAVEQSINPNKVMSPPKDCVFDEIANRMRNLRRWLRELENRLCPISLAASWTQESLEERFKEQEKLQKEIEAQGKYVSSLLKLCEHLKGNVRFGQNSLMIWDAERVRKVANNLEHRWHTIWLKSLECQCILEDLMQNCMTGFENLDKSFSEEPLKKYPRLSGYYDEISVLENELKDKMNYKCDDVFVDDSLENCCLLQADVSVQRDDLTFKNDKAVMVGDTSIAELKSECKSGKFEIVQDVGYSSETSAHLSNDEKLDPPDLQSDVNTIKNGLVSSAGIDVLHKVSSPLGSANLNYHKVYLAPDKYPSVSLKTLHILAEDKPLYNSKYSSCKAVPDTFYKVTSVDDEELEDAIEGYTNIEKKSQISEYTKDLANFHSNDKQVSVESFNDSVVINEVPLKNSSQDTENNLNVNSHKIIEKESNIITHKNSEKDEIGSKHSNIPFENHTSFNVVQKRGKRNNKQSLNNALPKALQPNELWKKSARVREWLNTCQSADDGTSDDNVESREKSTKSDWPRKVVDSSCDASGECTTTESDSEKSNTSDVNNSVSFSQSFTGSIETVIPAVPEENNVVQSDRAGSTEPSSGIRLRKKKRASRDRPWSVTDVHQATFTSPSVPHSTSESALDLLYSSQEYKKSGNKKLCSENKRLSLTDVSTLSCPSIKSHKVNQHSPKSSNHRSSSGSEKHTSRKKRGSNSDRSSDNYDSTYCTVPEINILTSSKSSTDICPDSLPKIVQNACCDVPVVFLEKICTSEEPLSLESKPESAITGEDQGSISDQAWDEYQDPPYLSEPYSEQTADEDEVKKLINFGDDYRAILGSYSDASSVSIRMPPHKSHRTRSKSLQKPNSQGSRDSFISDSNSDSEDFHNIIKTSNKALQFVTNSLKENAVKMSSFSSEFAELVATCQTNLCHLHAIHNELTAGCELESLSDEDVQKLQSLIKEWEELQVNLLSLSKSESEQKTNSVDLEAAIIDVHCSLAALKEKLSTMAVNAVDAGGTAFSFDQLKANIQNLQVAMSNLQEMKESVLSVSARVLRLVAEGGGPAITPLRDNATKLYQQWEDVYELNCSQLTKLQTLQSRWHESTENELDADLETTVQWHPVQVGSSLPIPKVSTEALYQSTAAEIQVADQHDILLEIETDSTKASIQCCLVENDKEDLKEPILHLSPPALKMRSKCKNNIRAAAESQVPCSRSRFWRSLRAAVPIQFALVILYCMSCLMEPRCCENMNNYDFSILPQLRYLRGPPPV